MLCVAIVRVYINVFAITTKLYCFRVGINSMPMNIYVQRENITQHNFASNSNKNIQINKTKHSRVQSQKAIEFSMNKVIESCN